MAGFDPRDARCDAVYRYCQAHGLPILFHTGTTFNSRAPLAYAHPELLDDVAIRLKNDPRSRLVVVGYADPAEAGAERLAGQRAQNAKEYLMASGIADARIDDPVADTIPGLQHADLLRTLVACR